MLFYSLKSKGRKIRCNSHLITVYFFNVNLKNLKNSGQCSPLRCVTWHYDLAAPVPFEFLFESRPMTLSESQQSLHSPTLFSLSVELETVIFENSLFLVLIILEKRRVPAGSLFSLPLFSVIISVSMVLAFTRKRLFPHLCLYLLPLRWALWPDLQLHTEYLHFADHGISARPRCFGKCTERCSLCAQETHLFNRVWGHRGPSWHASPPSCSTSLLLLLGFVF